MSSKRKFIVPEINVDEESGGSSIGQHSAFKKYKEEKGKEQDTTDELNLMKAGDLKGPSTSSSKQQLTKETNSVKKLISQQEKQDKRDDSHQTDIHPSTTGNIVNSTNPTEHQNQQKEKSVGKSFSETFSYLKNSNLYVLPPLPKQDVKKKPVNSNIITVNPRQRGNPILKHVKNVPWEYGEIVPDYEIGENICVLFLSMRYHSLNPDYIHERLKKLNHMYELRVLLVQVDVVNCKQSLKEIGRIAMLSSCTMILAWSPEEAGRYLETYKQYENKSADVLQQKVDTDHLSKAQDFLTTIKSINRTDVVSLLSTFGSIRNIVNASMEEIAICPGIGSLKAKRLHKAFNEPFKRKPAFESMVNQTEG